MTLTSRQKLYWKGILKVRHYILSRSGVERSAVNRFVVGSNPTWGVFKATSLAYKCIEQYSTRYTKDFVNKDFLF